MLLFLPDILQNWAIKLKTSVPKLLKVTLSGALVYSTMLEGVTDIQPANHQNLRKQTRKITRCTTMSERKQVFASKSKFQTESVKIEPTFALMQNILPRRFTYVNS